MPYEVNVDHAGRTIEVTGSGEGTAAEALSLIARHLDTVRDCPGYDFLYDASRLVIDASPADLMKIAEAVFEGGAASFRRFAIVLPEAQADLGRMFAALVQPFGVTANVFVDRQDATTWLAVDRT